MNVMAILKNLFGISVAGANAGDTTAANAAEGAAMANEATAASPAASGGFTLEQLNAAITAAVSAATGPLVEKIGTLEAGLKDVAGKSSPDAIAQLVGQQVTAAQSAQQTAATKAQAKADLRKKVIAAHLPGVDEALIHLPDSDDEATLTTAAKDLRGKFETSFKTKLPNVGGAANDGGQTAAAEKAPAKVGFLTMPGAAPAAPAAAAATK